MAKSVTPFKYRIFNFVFNSSLCRFSTDLGEHYSFSCISPRAVGRKLSKRLYPAAKLHAAVAVVNIAAALKTLDLHGLGLDIRVIVYCRSNALKRLMCLDAFQTVELKTSV